MAKLLGIDIGTGSAKAVVFESDTAQVLATAAKEYPVHRPLPDRAEQDPLDWWQATITTVRAATTHHPDIAAIGLSGQMHGGTFVDERGQVVHPAIIWADQRASQYITPLLDAVGHERYPSLTGTLPAVGFMAVTLLWLQAHMPDVLTQAHKFLLPKDYVHYQLTGHMTTEPTDAAATGLFDVAQSMWSSKVLDAIGIDPALYPAVRPSSEVTELTAAAAAELNLTAGIPVVTGCADQPAQALANGILTPGTVSVTVGSGGQVFAPMTTIQTDPRLHVFNHAVPGMVYALGAILSAGLSLRWLRGVLGMSTDADGYAMLSGEAAKVPLGADGLLFLPYLSGERTPLMDPHARGGFIGLSSYHTRGHLARAVMEGVAFAMRHTLEVTQEVSGQVDTLIGSGGAVESDIWRRILTDVIGMPLRKSLVKEQSGVGAAVLAGIGAGIYPSFEAAGEQVAAHDVPTEPNPDVRSVYDDRYAQFKSLYPTLKADLHQLGGANSA